MGVRRAPRRRAFYLVVKIGGKQLRSANVLSLARCFGACEPSTGASAI